ncbi:hypothetical protein [Planctomicrobium sp. SH664]|uniref:hypothetical protein n=1 Tax=Planctomicrobium sp. SH664 TaxID=3448125 RepID=UPI003F5B2DBC
MRANDHLWRCPNILLMLLSALALQGCNPDSGGAFQRFDLTGTVIYDQKPVPVGIIRFLPDQSKGNQGPGSSCRIVDGKYQTPPGQGAVSGDVIVQILGFANQKEFEHGERPLFPQYQTEALIPKQGGTMDFNVPLHQKSK